MKLAAVVAIIALVTCAATWAADGASSKPLNAEELRVLSDDELMAYIQKQVNSGGGIELTRAQAELNARFDEKAQREHWTTTPTFWLTLIAAIAAVIAAAPVVNDWRKAWKNRKDEKTAR